MEWLAAAAVFLGAVVVLPATIRAMHRWLRTTGSGAIVLSFGTGLANELDPSRAAIVKEAEKAEEKEDEATD